MAERLPAGRVVVFDDDHYYMGGVLAELLARQGCQVTLVTPAPLVSYWAQFTLEQERIQRRLMSLGVGLQPQHVLQAIQPDAVSLAHTISGATLELPCEAVVLVTDRQPNDELYQALKPALAEGKLQSLRVIGDAEAPNIIAQAFEETLTDDTPFRVERVTS
jgi:dimethylamine/trimethylamine dehydrogenase